MDYRLKAISKYNKKSAKKTNHYKRFKPGKDQILIDDDFAIAGEQSIAFTDSKTDYKKALKSPIHSFTQAQGPAGLQCKRLEVLAQAPEGQQLFSRRKLI